MSDDNTTQDSTWRAILGKPVHASPLPSIIEVDVGARSDCGKVQAHNTDHYLAIRLGRVQQTMATSLAAADLPEDFEEYGYALLVADGLGEQSAGIRASRVALSAIAHLAIQFGRWNVRGSDSPADTIEQGELFYRRANDAVLEASRSDERLAGMAASMTAVYIAGIDLFFAHVGHAKAFLFRDGALIRLTTDDLVRQPETLGGRVGGPNVEIEHIRLWSGDRVLLATNGLTDALSENQIADTVALRRRPNDDCQRLIDQVLAAGGPDNVTVLLADYRIRATSTSVETVWPV
jgi:serine/threonine protein phosphatase PrpC